MPTLYGEGKRAFRRLQEEIMRVIPDQSLFAWSMSWNFYADSLTLHAEWGPTGRLSCTSSHRYRPQHMAADASLLAPSLDLFSFCGSIEAVPHDEVARRLQLEGKPNIPTFSYDFTPHGIRTQLPTIPLSLYLLGGATEDGPLSGWYLVVLGCEHSDLPGHLLGRICHISAASGSNIQFLYSGIANVTVPAHPPAHPGAVAHNVEILPLSLTPTSAQLPSLQIDFKTVHIPHSDRRINEPRVVAFRKTHERMCLVLPKKTRHALRAQGYTPSLQGSESDRAGPNSQWLTLLHSDKSHSIIIEFQHTLVADGVELSLEAYVRIAAGARGLRDDHLWELVGTVSWRDSYPWAQVLEKRVVVAKIGLRKLKIVFELHLVAPGHYVPHVEICDECQSSVAPSSRWKRPWTATGSPSEPVDTSSEQNMEEENEGSDKQAEEEQAETRQGESRKDEGGGPTDGGLTVGAPSWWGLACNF
ncbi:hypothetical protein V8D89_000393 [Ganoderma adspersum]